ncbi:MAG: cation:proton antiporter [Arcobacteraceae bacterium]
MDNILVIIFSAICIATILNITLKRFGVSHIIGYILSGTIISYIFSFNGMNFDSLELIGEFGIVFLMFTIGLELNFDKIKKMKELLFVNGLLQVLLSALIIFIISYFIFNLSSTISIIIALAFSLSSTAIVLTYLKDSKDIYTPYGKKSVGILIFQDLAVIPILLLITFLTNDTLSISQVLLQTVLAALFILVFMFTIGKRIVKLLLSLSAKTQVEELFLGSVFSIVMGTSLLAHEVGFTYSLGAFIAGMIIADTGYSVKVESDIVTYKDLLLGTFFFSVGTKIDAVYVIQNIHIIFSVLALTMLIKTIVIYFIIRLKEDKSTSIKTAISLGQIGEFSFAIFALAFTYELIPKELSNFLILVTVLSMIVTPFIVNNIYKIAALFVTEFYESDKITPIKAKNHVIIVGFATLGRIVAQQLTDDNISFVIISDNLKHVLLAKKRGYMAYFGHLDKKPVLESLKVQESSSIILTTNKELRKRLISDAVLEYHPKAHIIVKIDSVDEKKYLKDLDITDFVDINHEVSNLLVNHAKLHLEATNN